MKIRPILFSTPMVQALLDGRKTMTRRVVKPQPFEGCNFVGMIERYPEMKQGYYWSNGIAGDLQGFYPGIGESIFCPYGEVGDILWVRETYKYKELDRFSKAISYRYLADDPDARSTTNRFKPSLLMPKVACRIWLKVVGVRVERLREITKEDAKAEGVKQFVSGHWKDYSNLVSNFDSSIGSFASLWISINGIGSWHANPWVWVVEFERCERPEGWL